jgi:hypothetical protein
MREHKLRKRCAEKSSLSFLASMSGPLMVG